MTKNFIKNLDFVIFDPIENKIIGRLYPISLKILVTGGAGFIGKYIVDYLLKDHQVTIYDNLSNSSKDDIENIIKKGVYFVQGDILDYETLQKSCKGIDIIIHLAAKSDVADSQIHPGVTNEVNVLGTQNVIKCCIQNKINLIFASSAAVYIDSALPVNEKSQTGPVSPYGKSKLDAERKIQQASKEFGFDAVSLRMFNVYGKGQNKQYAGVISKFLKNISENKSIQINGDGNQTRDFVSIYDVIEAFDCAIKNISGKKGDIYNIGTGNAVSVNDLAEIIQKILGKKIPINHVSQQTKEVKHSVANVSLAKNELGFVAKHKLKDDLINLL